jgi:cardiolipin synthase
MCLLHNRFLLGDFMKRALIQFGLAIIGLISILSLQSCQMPSLNPAFRIPAADKKNIDSKKVAESYALSIELDYLKAEQEKLAKKIKNSSAKENTSFEADKLRSFDEQVTSLEKRITSLNSDSAEEIKDLRIDIPVAQWGELKKDWRKQIEKLIITEPSHYALENGKIKRELTIDLSGTTDYQLGIVNKFWTPEKNTEFRNYFDADIQCDSDFKMKKNLFSKIEPKNKEISFKIFEQANSSPTVVLFLNQKINSCEITFKDPAHPETMYGVRLVNDKKDRTHLAEIKNRFETCVLPDSSGLKGVEKLFLTPKYKSMTCAEEVNDIKTLEEPIEGLKAKAETLLGQPLPDGFTDAMNPYAELDFSHAPKLNTVLISYLVFRHDFYGTLIARLAKWHADHGAQVRILMSDVISNKKDRLLLHGLVESSNNIKVQEFRYDSDGGGLWDHFSEYHRTMHVKLLITLSDEEASNVVYIGGRNIHDGFAFMKTPDHSAFPELIQYGSAKGSDEGYAPWRDYEMRITSKNLAEQIASHYMTLWQRDSQSFYVRSINQNFVSKTPVDPKYFEREGASALVRHFMSIPYTDDEALEKFYINIFDSAEKSIRLSTPYFRPTAKLGAAIERAVARGVDVTLITRIDLSGDTAAIILSEVNKSGINQFLNKIKIYEYTEPGVILHSKIILVDGKMSIIGSVNLNKRSFIHDMESGVMVYSPEYNKKMNTIMDGYRKQTREVTEKQKIALWKKVVIGIFDTEF